MKPAFTLSTPIITKPNTRTTLSKRPRRYTLPNHRIVATAQKEPKTQPQELRTKDATAANGTPAPPVLHSTRELQKDIIATLAWISVAAVTATAFFSKSHDHGLQFVTAYIVEYALSVDNLFVFLLIFEYFRVPRASQTRVLTYGIIGAVSMRGIMIVAGEALTKRFKAVTVAFAGLLLFSATKLLLQKDHGDDDLEHNAVVKFSKSLINVADFYDGDRFFTRLNGTRLATPMLLVLLCIEFSDVVFALDSVPAVLGISDDTVVIYLSNILAIAGLRNLYFVLSDAIGDLRFLTQSLAIVLGFVGAKMLAGVAGFEVGVVQSLSVVVGTLAAGVGLSLAFPEDVAEGVPPSEV